jgi:uncharacterized Fe-S cluster-containing radical SAM superfamily protein
MKTGEINFTKGWYPEERTAKGPFRWMQKQAICIIKDMPTKGDRELVLVAGHPFNRKKNPILKVYANNNIIGEREISPSSKTYPFPLKNRSKDIEIQLQLDRIFKLDREEDQRDLGIMVEKIKIHSEQTPSFPSILEIETSTYCNINPPCVMCYPRIFDTRQFNGDIDGIAFERLIPHLRGFRTISLHGVGEPLLGKKLFIILDNIDTDKTDVQFNSNGLLLTEDLSRELIAKKLKLIDFSLDAATAETYKKIRRSDFSLVTKNIQRLSEIKRELGARHPTIKLNMTLMNENLMEVVPFIEMAGRLDAEIVHLGLLNPFKDYRADNGSFAFRYKDQMIDTNSDLFKKTITRAKQKAVELDIRLLLEFSIYYS